MPPKITFQIYIEQEIGKKQARNNQTLLGCFEVWIDASESEFILIGPFKFNKTAAIKSVLRAVETPYPKVNPGEEEFQIDLTKMNAQDSTSGHQCTMCILGSMFTFQPNKLRHILKFAS